MFRHHCVILRELAFITLQNYMITIVLSLVDLQKIKNSQYIY